MFPYIVDFQSTDVCSVSVVPLRPQNQLPKSDSHAPREPRMPPSHRILHFQARMSVNHLHFFYMSVMPRPHPGLHKYSEAVYEACLRSFCALPIAALVDGKFFCVHGGLSPQLVTLADLASVCFFPFITSWFAFQGIVLNDIGFNRTGQ